MNTGSKTSTALAIALCAVGLSAAAALAADAPKTARESGTIKSVDSSSSQVVITNAKDSKDQNFVWGKQTRFREEGKTVTASELKTGERVRISYKAGTGTPMLDDVTIIPSKTTSSPPSSSTPKSK